ncbi:MAG: hypothetical protein K0S58_2243 [Nitrospira sp.]|jgi:hypothetical protein|nr:hypothetical protein [Nitrospira sp.]
MISRIMASKVLEAAVQADSSVAGASQQAMTTRALVPDDIVIGVLIARLRRSDCTTGIRSRASMRLRCAEDEHGSYQACSDVIQYMRSLHDERTTSTHDRRQ